MLTGRARDKERDGIRPRLRLLRRVGLLSSILAGLALLAHPAYATEFWTTEDYERSLAEEYTVILSGERLPSPPLRQHDYRLEFIQTTGFLGGLQVDDPGDPEFGGELEGESRLFTQSDNTSEVVWVWSRLEEKYGIDSLLYRVGNAWTYLANFPAYLEEGGSDPDSGYYRVYNCGWALRAEMEYRLATGDTSHREYADSCADYLVNHPLNLHPEAIGIYPKVNGPVEAWAVGNLYEYGMDVGNPTYVNAAVGIADSIRTWVEEDSTRLSETVWAMSGGTTMWGLVHSYFAAYPEEAVPWVQHYAPYLGFWALGGQMANGWNGWYALGHWAVWEVTGDPDYLDGHLELTDSLLAKDGDDDGGIPRRYIDPDTWDESWCSSYMAFMALDKRNVYLTSVASRGWESRSPELTTRARPNPFRGTTTVEFRLPAEDFVSLSVFDLSGRRVRSWGPYRRGPGEHAIVWDGRDLSGNVASPGVYFYRLRHSSGSAGGKILLTR